MAVDDEIWRPGYGGPAPVSGETSLDRATSADDLPMAAGRRSWRLVAAVVALGAVAVTAVGVIGSQAPDLDARSAIEETPPIDVIDDDRLEFASSEPTALGGGGPLQLLDDPSAPYAGADTRRLPTDVVPRWTTALPPLVADGGANAATWVEAVDSRSVIVGIGDARSLTGPAAVHVIDASTGTSTWSMQVETRIDNVEVIAAIGDVLVLTVGIEIVARDLRDGSQLWSSELTEVDGTLQQISPLQGTDLLQLSTPDPEDPIDLVDPATGTVVGELVGDVLGSDGDGRWYVLRGDKLLEFDLNPGLGAESTGAGSVPTIVSDLIATIDSERILAAAVVGTSLVATADGRLAVGPLAVDGERASGPGGFTPLSTEFDTPDELVLVSSFEPLGGAAFAVVGGGKVSGAEVLDDTVRFAWQRRGTVTATYPTERGIVLLLGTDGGSAQTLVDAASGETIVALTMSPGLFGVLEVAGNGIVTGRTSRDGSRVAGLDLDGNELWALDGSTPVSIGDGIVARSTPQPDGSFEVTAYGDPG